MRKIFNLITKILIPVIFIIAVLFAIITCFTLMCQKEQRSILGYYSLIVKTDSMKATDFAAGDLIFIKKVKSSALQKGDIIAFQSRNKENYGEIVTHKIRKVLTLDNGNVGFITYGTTTDVDDESIVTTEFILGKYQGKIPKIGHLFSFLKTVPGYIVFVLIPFLLLMFFQSVKCIQIYKQYKLQQSSELEVKNEFVEPANEPIELEDVPVNPENGPVDSQNELLDSESESMEQEDFEEQTNED